MFSSLRQTSYPFSRLPSSSSCPSWSRLWGLSNVGFPFCQVLINGVPLVFFVKVIQPTMDCITDEKVFIQRFCFPIVSRVRSGHVATRDCEKKIFSCPGSAGIGLCPSRTYKIVSPSRGSMNQLLKWHNTKLISTDLCSSVSLQNVGLDTKKDPRRRSRGLDNSSEPMLGASLGLGDHLSVFIRFFVSLWAETFCSNTLHWPRQQSCTCVLGFE